MDILTKLELKEWEEIYLRLKLLLARRYLETNDPSLIEDGKRLNENWSVIKECWPRVSKMGKNVF